MPYMPSDSPDASVAAKAVEIWTDGGCKPNPGPGGWGAVLRFGDREREMSGAEPKTTNNRMELTAAAAALEALTKPCTVVLHTDSEYVRNGVTRWSAGWVRKNGGEHGPVAKAAGGSGGASGRVALGTRAFRRRDEREGGRAGDQGQI
jgi:ribonuclease HI